MYISPQLKISETVGLFFGGSEIMNTTYCKTVIIWVVTLYSLVGGTLLSLSAG